MPQATDAVQENCLSFCFSTNTRGAIALTGLGCPRAKPVLELKRCLSPVVEALLIRDGILAAGSLKDMAQMTWETLDAVEASLGEVEQAPVEERAAAAAQIEALRKLRELRRYCHIDEGLGEASAVVLMAVHRAETEPLTRPNLGALRDVLQRMRKIAMTTEDVDWCVERLESGGLDMFDALGGEDDGV